ncbi:MAG TPA: hypothetical protein VGC66_18740 [Pyrinomonadaceae bacterium]|jgi:hypothetical protein
MKRERAVFRAFVLALFCSLWCGVAAAQSVQEAVDEEEFGPVVRAYLGYLRDEQEVVDDRKSRREISAAYYRRNSNRIRALRQTAIRIARESGNDYLPELEAATRDEMKNLFERPPSAASLRMGEVINNTYRYLGTVRSVEIFYIFARLDPYEQAELMKKEKRAQASDDKTAPPSSPAQPSTTAAGDGTRPRRASSP